MTASPRAPMPRPWHYCAAGKLDYSVSAPPAGRSKARRGSGPSPNHRGGWGDMPTQYLRTPTIHQGPAPGLDPWSSTLPTTCFSQNLDGSTRIPRIASAPRRGVPASGDLPSAVACCKPEDSIRLTALGMERTARPARRIEDEDRGLTAASTQDARGAGIW